MKCLLAAAAAVLLLSPVLCAQQGTTATEAPNKDTSYIDPSGTAHITRVIPIPPDLSPEARAWLARPVSDANIPVPLEERRRRAAEGQEHSGQISLQMYPAHVSEGTLAGVPVRMVTPLSGELPDRVLLNIHGGSFIADSGSLTETIPIASLTRIKVVAVLYRLAPEHPFPAGLDDVIADYRELLKTYSPVHIGIYGTSAGAILTAETAARIRQMGLPEPALLGIFSGLGDFSRNGDSWAMYNLHGLSGYQAPPPPGPHDPYYIGDTDPRDPVLSPLFSDLRNMPPTLFISSGRDALLSGTTILHRAFLRAGNDDARLVVFEGLPHAFWLNPELPESKEADSIMARFFTKILNR